MVAYVICYLYVYSNNVCVKIYARNYEFLHINITKQQKAKRLFYD